jgi:hypothetical protein
MLAAAAPGLIFSRIYIANSGALSVGMHTSAFVRQPACPRRSAGAAVVGAALIWRVGLLSVLPDVVLATHLAASQYWTRTASGGDNQRWIVLSLTCSWRDSF